MNQTEEQEQRRRHTAATCRRIADVTKWGFVAFVVTGLLYPLLPVAAYAPILVIELAAAFVVTPCMWMMARAVEGREMLPRSDKENW